MAESLEIGILDLISEFLAHTFGFFTAFEATGAVTARAGKTLPDGFGDGFIGVFPDLHISVSLRFNLKIL